MKYLRIGLLTGVVIGIVVSAIAIKKLRGGLCDIKF